MSDTHEYLAEAADVVSAYVSNNKVEIAEIAGLIHAVYAALQQLSEPVVIQPTQLVPAVPIKKSVTSDYIISLEDGKKFKTLKRHLKTNYGMTPDDYRTKWGLPSNYPMVAPGYSDMRAELAKSVGLGRKKAVDTATESPKKGMKKPGRKTKASA